MLASLFPALLSLLQLLLVLLAHSCMSSDSDLSLSLAVALSDTDALILKHYGRDIMQDSVGAIVQSIFCSKCFRWSGSACISSRFAGAYGIFFAVAMYSIL
jgi:hypothetical protein